MFDHSEPETTDSEPRQELMYAHGANLNFRAFYPMIETIFNFYYELKFQKQSSKHERTKYEDIFLVIKTLQQVNALMEIQGRIHQGVGTIPKDPISSLDFKEL